EWIQERQDVETLSAPSSAFTQQTQRDIQVENIRFQLQRNPLRAKAGKNVTQLHYARQGIITPEMECIAIRENQQRLELGSEAVEAILNQRHLGQAFGATIPDTITQNLCAKKLLRAAPLFPTTSITLKANP